MKEIHAFVLPRGLRAWPSSRRTGRVRAGQKPVVEGVICGPSGIKSAGIAEWECQQLPSLWGWPSPTAAAMGTRSSALVRLTRVIEKESNAVGRWGAAGMAGNSCHQIEAARNAPPTAPAEVDKRRSAARLVVRAAGTCGGRCDGSACEGGDLNRRRIGPRGSISTPCVSPWQRRPRATARNA